MKTEVRDRLNEIEDLLSTATSYNVANPILNEAISLIEVNYSKRDEHRHRVLVHLKEQSDELSMYLKTKNVKERSLILERVKDIAHLELREFLVQTRYLERT